MQTVEKFFVDFGQKITKRKAIAFALSTMTLTQALRLKNNLPVVMGLAVARMTYLTFTKKVLAVRL